LQASLPHCRPAEYESWLREFGLEQFDAQDRVVRDDSPLAVAPTLAGDRELTVERVTHACVGEWVEFIERVFLPALLLFIAWTLAASVHLVRRTSQQQAPIGEPQASTGS
jgi:hypothetical protein